MNNLEKEYLEALNTKANFTYCIVGIDPYPNGATGIPFMKESWDNFINARYSAKQLFFGLGFELDKESKKYKSPKEFYLDLVKKGYAFLNLSYSLLPKNNKVGLIEAGFRINKPILDKSNNIVFVTKTGYKLSQKFYSGYKNITVVPHPKARQNRQWGNQIGDLLNKKDNI